MLRNKGTCIAQRNKIPIFNTKIFYTLFVWHVIMCKHGFAEGIYFSKEFYASICILDWFPKDADSFFVQHIVTYLTNYRV